MFGGGGGGSGASSGGGGGGGGGGGILSGPDPKEQAKQWRADMRGEMRKVDRQITKIQREEVKVKQSIKAAAKRGDNGSAKLLAKEIVRTRKAVTQLHTSKAHMNSVAMQITNQMSQKALSGQMKKSTEIMASMNKLMKVSEIQDTMQKMSTEMMKAGVIEEMTQDAMEALDESDDEEAADEEVDKVLHELATVAMGGAAAAGSRTIEAKATAVAEKEDDDDMKALQARLEAIKQ